MATKSTYPLPPGAESVGPWKWTDKYDWPRDFKGYGKESHHPQWPNNAKIAISFVINYEEGAEYCVLNGDPHSETHIHENPGGFPYVQQRNLNVESEYEYGSRAGVWRVFRLFNKHGMKYTLYAVGQAIEKNPEVARDSVQNGHDIASHAYRWIDYHNMPPEEEKGMIKKGIQTIVDITGAPPKGWYYGRQSPRSLSLVWEVFKEIGLPLVWESDSYADDVPYWRDVPAEKDSPNPEGLLVVPYSYDCNDFRFAVPTGFHSVTDFYEHLKSAFDVLYEEGCEGSPKMMTVGLHCRMIGKPARLAALKKFVEYIEQKEGVWVATRTQIAEHFRKQFPYRKGHLA